MWIRQTVPSSGTGEMGQPVNQYPNRENCITWYDEDDDDDDDDNGNDNDKVQT
ncbi:hypothetical protein BofuT4_uP057000.1 [Botrytis cinerea T4]|uniref:Uncharacterized protein n=1 Tax=Botryotinia fuckeliana (strain T4) TaxID=999810 RepID=G2XWC9_BOTF4|nr:hypothetical protein BofuT4_uP057000.1 [Botrytis cinerea T4]